MTKHTPELIQPQLPFDEIPYGFCKCGCGQKTNMAKRGNSRLGIIKGEPHRFINQHHVRVQQWPTLEERFWKKVGKRGSDDCWEWQACRDKRGYGVIQSAPERLAHRLSWVLHNGPIPKNTNYAETCVLHKCDNPPCCNPAHLFLGTQKDNSADMVRKGRQGHGDHRGELHGCAKLTEQNVRDIRELITQGMSRRELAKRYNVSTDAIGDIVRHRSWRHVP